MLKVEDTSTLVVPKHHFGKQGCYFMSLSAWTWIGEHDQGSMTKSFLKYFSHVDRIFKEYFVTPRTKYLVMWKNIFPCVMDEWYLGMNMWMKNDNGWTFSWTFVTSFVLWKIEQKK
jgi:hypothetical protein